MKVKTLEKFVFYIALLFGLIYLSEYILWVVIMIWENFDKIYPYVLVSIPIYWFLYKINKFEENIQKIISQMDRLKTINDCLRSIDYQLDKKFNPEDYRYMDDEEIDIDKEL